MPGRQAQRRDAHWCACHAVRSEAAVQGAEGGLGKLGSASAESTSGHMGQLESSGGVHSMLYGCSPDVAFPSVLFGMLVLLSALGPMTPCVLQ